MKTILEFRAIKVTRLVFPECRFASWNSAVAGRIEELVSLARKSGGEVIIGIC